MLVYNEVLKRFTNYMIQRDFFLFIFRKYKIIWQEFMWCFFLNIDFYDILTLFKCFYTIFLKNNVKP